MRAACHRRIITTSSGLVDMKADKGVIGLSATKAALLSDTNGFGE
jgi:hypothetical protein